MRRWLSAFTASLLAGLFCSVSCYRPVLHDCVVECGLDGSCPQGASCSNGWCTTGSGACERPPDGAAEPALERCDLLDAPRCGAPGQVERCLEATLTWTTAELCADETPACVAGSCRACAPGARTCVGEDAFRACIADGSWGGAVSACPLEQPRCVGGACRPRVQVTAGGAHTCVVGASGNVRCFGDNTFGQLGVGDHDARGASKDAPPPTDARLGSFISVAVSAGGSHTCAFDAAGSVRCWGQNGSGQLGLGDREARGGEAATLGDSLPPLELGPTPIVALSAGNRHTCGLFADGRVKCWGANESGQLGSGDRQARGGRAEDMGEALPSVELGRDAYAVAIDAGDNHTCAVLADGRAKCWGENEYGQLGLAGAEPGDRADGVPAAAVDTTRRALGVSAGGNHTCVLFEDQRVSCFGAHAAGQIGADPPDATPVNIDAGVPQWVELGEGARELAAGASHTCAILADGDVKCWGLNVAGQLGYGDTRSRGREVAELGDALPVVELGEPARGQVTSIGAGLDVSCAAYATGGVKCWGLNASGQLGQGDTESRGDEPDELGDALSALPLD